jgi:hypothetical protein
MYAPPPSSSSSSWQAPPQQQQQQQPFLSSVGALQCPLPPPLTGSTDFSASPCSSLAALDGTPTGNPSSNGGNAARMCGGLPSAPLFTPSSSPFAFPATPHAAAFSENSKNISSNSNEEEGGEEEERQQTHKRADISQNDDATTTTSAATSATAAAAAAEEDDEAECRRHRERPQRQQHDMGSPSSALFLNPDDKPRSRLHLHPLATTSGYPTVVDPITAALARQQQQLFRGEPRSPLSPRTLQALCSASAEGRHLNFLAQLTPEDVLAPPPLALTWYPSVPPGVTQHAERKRRSDGAIMQHEAERLAEECEDVMMMNMGDDAAAAASGSGSGMQSPPLRRARGEPYLVSAVLSSSSFAETLASAAVTGSGDALPCGSGNDNVLHSAEARADVEGGVGEAGLSTGGAAVHAHADPHHKRERSEPVFEYQTHGRRLH